MIMDIIIYPVTYKMFDYENTLRIDEIRSLFPDAVLEHTSSNAVHFKVNEDQVSSLEAKLSRLTYSSHYELDNTTYYTSQHKKELSCGKTGHQNRQSTRYGAHGIHEYKGKFNPQIVSSLFNIMKINPGDKIIDPFCGSGTSLVEASYFGLNAQGFDINPLACFISNTKVNAHKVSKKEIVDATYIIKNDFSASLNIPLNTPRLDYLSKWFEPEYLSSIESIRSSILKIDNENLRNILLLITSNLLRDYSKQEPSDLRIRRRISAYPDKSILDCFMAAAIAFANNISSLSEFLRFSDVSCFAKNMDIRNVSAAEEKTLADGAITSPPYATALPYIDTQRLSLVWLGLISPDTINPLEKELIGSREITKKNIDLIRDQLFNETELPPELVKLCKEMLSSLSDTDGFRRQATPFVIYRYLKDMAVMFKRVSHLLRKGAEFSLVVGSNHTVLGGRRFDLDTPLYLQLIAENLGWELVENRVLDAYQRYGLHAKNASKSEHLIRLKNI